MLVVDRIKGTVIVRSKGDNTGQYACVAVMREVYKPHRWSITKRVHAIKNGQTILPSYDNDNLIFRSLSVSDEVRIGPLTRYWVGFNGDNWILVPA